jgi:very-short-patch-repair endonuclease
VGYERMEKLYNDKSLQPLRRKLRTGSTDAERYLWQRLKNKQILSLRFLRQYGVGNYILDFYCPLIRLAIELDGGQHAENREADESRTAFLSTQDIVVLRFWNNDVFKNTDGVLQVIFETSEALMRRS